MYSSRTVFDCCVVLLHTLLLLLPMLFSILLSAQEPTQLETLIEENVKKFVESIEIACTLYCTCRCVLLDHQLCFILSNNHVIHAVCTYVQCTYVKGNI